MPIVILLTTTGFLIIELTSNFSDKITNPIFSYFLTLLGFFVENPVILITILLCLNFYFAVSTSPRRLNDFLGSFFGSTTKTIQILLLSSLISYVFLLIFAFIQLNFLAILINNNASANGVLSNSKSIISTLKNNNFAPKLRIITDDSENYITEVAAESAGTTSSYATSILHSVPPFLIIPVSKPQTGIVLIDNTLIITDPQKANFEQISPVLAYLFVKEYFATRTIKSYPKIAIMDALEYSKFRKDDAADKQKKIDQEVAKITTDIASESALIDSDQNTLLNTANSIVIERSQYKKCLSTNGKNCPELKIKLNSDVDQATSSAEVLNNEITGQKILLENNTFYKNYYNVQKKVVSISSLSIPHEFGVFIPENQIKIAKIYSDNYTPYDFMETLVHEYLHYASYAKGHVFASTFFEEGLTEYFARQITNFNLGIKTNLGYPVQVSIISEITKSIPETELADIYFTKDEARLESTLDRVYGDNFYKNNEALFGALQYTSEKEQVLKIANQLMAKINGPKLTGRDLEGTFSSDVSQN
ncbi:MAG TPA: hypothetical protein VG965_02840 [Patescibacteria group bacterium]|nr:hypothetical protein [Patescibacteria group bacterium]